MSPASYMSGRLHKLHGVLLGRARVLSTQPVRRRAVRRPTAAHCTAEPLEPRLLLSGTTSAAPPTDNFATQYVIYNSAGGTSGVSTQAGGASPSDFFPLGSSSQVGLTPQQIRAAYGIDSIMVGSLVGDGTGQTIAIGPAIASQRDSGSIAAGWVGSNSTKAGALLGELGYFGADMTLTCTVLGHAQIRRASHVEPDGDGLWWADLAPVKGPRLGPFETRGQALAAEQEWLSQFLEMHFSSSMQPLS